MSTYFSPAAALRFQYVGQITNFTSQCALSSTSYQVTSTAAGLDTMPYFTVDLGSVYQISNVTIFNRADCCQNQFSQFQILVRPNHCSASRPPGILTASF